VLSVPRSRVAALFGVSDRAVRRWRDGERRVPRGVDILTRLLAAGVVTIDEVEQAAVRVPAQTNGGAKPELPPAPLPLEPTAVLEQHAPLPFEPAMEPSAALVELTSEPSALFADPVMETLPPVWEALHPDHDLCAVPAAEAATLADSDLTGAGSDLTVGEKVAALTAQVCHWPCGDPQHSDFRFCGSPVVAPPYCDEHRALAYMALPLRPAGRG
jgi:GcrA cell cycle regulator